MATTIIDQLRFNKNRPASLPPTGLIDLFFDKATGTFRSIDSTGTEVAIGTGEEETAASIKAKLDGETLVASIELADTGASAEDEGVIGLNSSGQLVLHDDDRVGDDLPYFITSQSRINFRKAVLAATMNNALYSTKLCEIPLSAVEATTGNYFKFEGKISVEWDNTNHPDFAYLAFVAEGQTTLDISTDGFYFPIGLGVSSELIDINGLLTLADDGANWKVAAGQTAPMAFIRRNNAGTVTDTVAWKTGDDIVPSTNGAKGADAQANKLSLYLVTYDESDTVDSGIKILGHIALEQV